MERIVWNGFAMDVDLEATRDWYAQAEDWDCPCGHCRNWLALEGQLPAFVQKLMERLGIAHRKASHVCELYHRGRQLLYEASYLVAGTFVSDVAGVGRRNDAVLEERNARPYPTGFGEGFPAPCFVLRLEIWMPWILPEPIDGTA